jgi:hypothetical protein
MQDSPYQSAPMSQQPAPMPVPSFKPNILTVFGVLHLIMAGIGVVALFFTLASVFMTSAMSKFQAPGLDPAIMGEFQQATLWPNLLSAGFTLVLMLLLMVAGIKLLRGTRNALRWSNIYAGTSIASKVVSAVVAVVVVGPATQRMMSTIMTNSGAPTNALESMGGFMGNATSIGAVVSQLLACTYALLTLFLLNRQNIKEWFANHGA